MKQKITEQTKEKVDRVFETIKEKDRNIPKFLKVFNFQGQKSPIIASKMIEGLTNPDDVVLDPFFGTGAFVIGARKVGRKAVGIELDNYTYNFVRMLLTRIDEDKYKSLFNQLSSKVMDSVMSLYETEVDGEKNYIHKLHFDPKDQEYYRPKNHRDIVNGENIMLEFATSKGKKAKKFDKFDEEKLKECEALDTSRFPHHKLIENSRINITASSGADRYDRNFNNREKYALLTIQDGILSLPKSIERDALELVLAASIALSKISQYGDGTNYLYHVVPYTAQERNVWTLFVSKVEEVLKYKEQLSSILVSSVSEGSPIELIEGDYKTYLNSTNRVFDCIYTDPPYSDQVAYLERSQYFRDWLRIFYDSKEYTLSDEMLEKEIVVSNAPTRPGKTLETYLLDINDMFETLSKHIKDNGFLVLTLKLGQNKYFKILTDFINSARRNGFEFVGNYEIDQTDPTIRRQAAYLSTIMKQVIVVFQKLPSDKGYWFINAQNMEQWIIKNVYEQIEAFSEKYIDISTSLNDLSLRASEQLGIVLKTSDLEKAASVIRDNFYVSEHNIHLDSNELYLGLEDSNSLLIKLYDIIPVIIKKLLRTKGSFCKDDLYAEIGYLLFDGDTALFKYLNDNEDCKNHINNLLNNYCEVLDNKYVLRQAHNIHDKSAIDISTLDGYELEQLMKELLQAEGYVDVIKTGKAGDRGVDLIATQKLANGSTQKVIFQCKRWIGNVGSTPIQRLHSMMTLDSKSIKRAVCVTTSTYTKEAREVAKMTGVELINGSDLLSKLQKYFGDKYYHGALQLVESENNLKARFAEAAKKVR